MSVFRRIVVGLDVDRAGALTEGARLALEEARWLAGGGGVHVTLLHSTRLDELWDEPTRDFVTVGGTVSHAGRQALEAALGSLRQAGVDAELVLSDEAAWFALVRRVLREPAELVITGKRSRQRDDDRRLGSVALKLLRKCPCPVWVVRPGDSPRPRRVLAAVDRTAVGEAVLFLAARIASEAGAALHVVHALQLPLTVQWEGEAGIERWKREQRDMAVPEIRTRLEAAGRESGEDEIQVVLTSPTRAVLAAVERCKPDLIAMGTISRGGIAGMLVGNTAERLLGRIEESLLVVKPADFICPVEA